MLPDVSHLPLLNRQCHTPMVRTSTTNDNDSSDAGPEVTETLTPDEVYMIRRMNLQAGLVDAEGHALDVDTDEEADAEIRRELEQAENVALAPTPPPPVRQPNRPHQPRTFPLRPEHGFGRPLVHPSRHDDPQERKDRVRNYIVTYSYVFYPADTPLHVDSRVLNVQTGRLGQVRDVSNIVGGNVGVEYVEQGWGSRVETAPSSRFRRLVVQLDGLPHRPWVIS